jgi:excisionase family DNA binding protein
MQRTYLTTKEVAEQLRVTEHTVRKWCRTGQIAGVWVGREWRIAPKAVEYFLERQADSRKKEQ